jgi:choline dehydrogenase-like flavoprotein
MTSDWNSCAPNDPEKEDWDVVIAGAGLGGSVVAYHLSQQGFKVLLLERGGPPAIGRRSLREGRWKRLLGLESPETTQRRRSSWHKPLTFMSDGKRVDFYAALGSGPGGSSAIFGGALERLDRSDFKETASNSALSDGLPDNWPIGYDAFRPYYKKAEHVFGVRGTRDSKDPDDDADLLEPPPLSERDASFFGTFSQVGLSPYRLHVGIGYKPGCTECLGVPCPLDCKSTAISKVLGPALTEHGAKAILNCEVERLDATQSSISTIIARVGEKQLRIRGRVFVLAAGALFTPVILLNSKSPEWPTGLGNKNGLVGCGLMFHCSDIVLLSPGRRLSAAGPRKTISTRAFYNVDGKRLGSFQSLGIPASRQQVSEIIVNWLSFRIRRRLPLVRQVATAISLIATKYLESASLFATIMEDLPYAYNRVVADASRPSGFEIRYSKSSELMSRISLLRALINQRLASLRPIIFTSGENLNFGHPLGTCRFGSDPETSVLDQSNRVRGLDNLFVADASFFPSSGGVNPSLTIAANGFRVGEMIAEQLKRTKQTAHD